MDFSTTIRQLTLLPLRIFLGGKPSPSSKEKTRAFLDKCDGPIAHRGGVPENTLVAIRESEQNGAVAIEVDLAFTKDGHPVILHDVTVDRTCEGTGSIESLTLEEVRKFDFGYKAGSQYKGEKIPTLQELVALLKTSQLQLFLEVKDSQDLAVPVILDIFAKDSSMLSKIAVISFYPNMLLEVKRRNPDIVTGLIGSATELAHFLGGKRKYRWWLIHQFMVLMDKISFWFLMKWAYRRLGVGFLMPNKEDIITGRFDLEYYRSRGIGVVPWTVNTQKDKTHFSEVLKMPFITDCVDGYAEEQTEG